MILPQGFGPTPGPRPQPEAALFAALGDATRLALLGRLAAGGSASIARLSEGAPCSRQAVRKHLEVLAEVGLVLGEREGREHRWRLLPGRLDEAQAQLATISAQWDEALGRLKAFVEGELESP